MESSNNGFTNIINDWYENFGFMKNNGSDLVFTIVILIIFGLIIFYFYLKTHIPWLKKVWPDEKCNPAFLPFAFLVNPPKPPLSNLDVINNNFNGCIGSIFQNFMNLALAPFHFLTDLVVNIVSAIVNTFEGIKKLIQNIRDALGDQSSQGMQTLLNVMLPVQGALYRFNDSQNKASGNFAAILYLFTAIIDTVQSAILAIMKFIILFLILLIAVVLALLVIPFIGSALAAPPAAIALLIFIAMTAIVINMVIVFGAIMNKNVPKPP